MAQFNMTTHEEFATEDTLRQYLANQLVLGRLSLVVGAGISLHFGLPSWSTLVRRLFRDKKGRVPRRSTIEAQAEYFRHKYYEDDESGLMDAVHSALYRGAKVDFAALRGHTTLAGIGALLMASRRGNVSEVITLNYDDLLEIYLRYHGIVAQPVVREEHWTGYADVMVYHLHGFVPFRVEDERSERITLDQQSYSKFSIGTLWGQVALSIMRRRTCLFIGLSGSDKNLDTLLNAVAESHASREERTRYWGVTFSTDRENDPLRQQWQARNVFFKSVSDYDTDLPKFLFGICQEAASLWVGGKVLGRVE